MSVFVLGWGGVGVDFVNYLWEYVSMTSQTKILHAMCVKWRPIHIIHRGSGNPREEREGSYISKESKRGSSGWVRDR